MGLEKMREVNHGRIRAAARDVVLVDGHAHNLVELDSSFSFKHAFVEAGDDVLADVPHAIPFKRCVQDVAELYEIDASLESIEEHRKRVGLNVLSAKCFEAANIGTLLLDDGLALANMKDISWHKSIVNKVHRILRIEAVAEDLLKQDPPHGLLKWNFKALEEQYISTLKSLLSGVVSFKSIAAYRSGLNIDPTVTDQDAEEGLLQDIQLALKNQVEWQLLRENRQRAKIIYSKMLEAGNPFVELVTLRSGREVSKKRPVRLQNKNVIDMLFIRALELATTHGIPLQIHTGFGDRDLDLRLSNPLHLRSVLEDQRFSAARLVLLHASYPYMREATYLASVYPQVFLDFGLAIPKLTVRGMKTAVAELVELAPNNKVMFSTDGYAFPETYFLGAKWARTILAQVLCEAYDDGDLSVDQAIESTLALLRKNSLAFYKLEEESDGARVSVKSTGEFKDVEKEAENKVNQSLRHKRDSAGIGKFHRPTTWLDKVKYVRLLWGDASGQRRCRVVPTDRYKEVVTKTGVGLAEAAMGMSAYVDAPAAGCGLSGVGEIRLVPDATTGHEVPQWGHGLVLADMHKKPDVPWEYCPRSTLRRLVQLLDKEFGLVLKAGFEIEFYLLQKLDRSTYEGVDRSVYCSTNGVNQSLPTIESILSWMDTLEIKIEQFHAEGGGGQFELALEYDNALKIADNLLLAKEAISAAAISHNAIATFLPKPCVGKEAFGSGCHVHLSLWKDGSNVLGAKSTSDSNYGFTETGQHFVAGVLKHLPALLAIISPHPNSYERIQPHTWSGAYECWGQENKDVPLRSSFGLTSGIVNNVELKSFDGCANPHLGLAALLAAGIDGLRKKLQLPPPVDVDPGELEKEGRIRRLPLNLLEATKHLEGDNVLKELLGDKLFTAIVAIRKVDAECASSKEILQDPYIVKNITMVNKF